MVENNRYLTVNNQSFFINIPHFSSKEERFDKLQNHSLNIHTATSYMLEHFKAWNSSIIQVSNNNTCMPGPMNNTYMPGPMNDCLMAAWPRHLPGHQYHTYMYTLIWDSECFKLSSCVATCLHLYTAWSCR